MRQPLFSTMVVQYADGHCVCFPYLQAQGESLIRKALTELQLWALQRSFAFLSSSDSTLASNTAGTGTTSSTGSGAAQGGRGVPLIKDWAGVLSEVGDHQSLVASLKTSPYYSMFKVCAVQTVCFLCLAVDGACSSVIGRRP